VHWVVVVQDRWLMPVTLPQQLRRFVNPVAGQERYAGQSDGDTGSLYSLHRSLSLFPTRRRT
jgi:hypothetical protein